jgi:ABC-2 type transport system ATP-binding protein
LLSTHILSEVEAVCGRVIIIARGQIALDEELASFRKHGAITVEARGPADAIRAALQTIPGIDRVALTHRDGELGSFEIHARGTDDLREAISVKLVANGWPLRQLDLRPSSLEERFTQAVAHESLMGARLEAV